jgi:hypothetical protein
MVCGFSGFGGWLTPDRSGPDPHKMSGLPIIFIHPTLFSFFPDFKRIQEIFTLHLFSSSLLTLSSSLFSGPVYGVAWFLSFNSSFFLFFLFPLAAPQVFIGGRVRETDPRWYDRPKMQQTCTQRKSEGHERKGLPLLLLASIVWPYKAWSPPPSAFFHHTQREKKKNRRKRGCSLQKTFRLPFRKANLKKMLNRISLKIPSVSLLPAIWDVQPLRKMWKWGG